MNYLESKLEEKNAVLRAEVDAMEEKRASLRTALRENEVVLSELRRKAGEAQNALTLEGERMDAARSDVLRIEKEILEIDEKMQEKALRADQIRTLLIDSQNREEKISEELSLLRTEKEAKEKKREEMILLQGEILALRERSQLRLEQAAAKLSENEESFRILYEGEKNKEDLLLSLARSKEEALAKIEEEKAKLEKYTQMMEQVKERLAQLQ
jgi:chromosome segregation ATPase